MHQKTTQAFVVTTQVELKPHQKIENIALFDETGEPIDVSSLTVQTGDDILLTGYVPVTGNLLATDTLNEALAKFEARIEALETP